MHSTRDCVGPPLGRGEKVGMESGKKGAGRGYFGKGGRIIQGRKKGKADEGGKGRGRRKEGRGREGRG